MKDHHAHTAPTATGPPPLHRKDLEHTGRPDAPDSSVESHEKALRSSGVSRETVREALRIASVVHAAAATLDAESVLSVSV